MLNVPRNSITPLTDLGYVIPEAHRRQTWRALSWTAGLRLPGLEYPRHLGIAILWTSFVPSVLLPILCGSGWWILAAIIGMPIAASALFFLLRPFAIALPAHSRILGEAAKAVVGLNYGKLVREFGSSRDRENPRLIDLVLANDGLRAQV